MGGNLVDKCCETLVKAKKHAAWLLFTMGGRKVALPPAITNVSGDGEHIDYSDYEFRNGDSRKVKK